MIDPTQFSDFAEALFIFPWLIAGLFAYLYAKERADKTLQALSDMISSFEMMSQNRSLSNDERRKLKELSRLAEEKMQSMPRY